MARAGKPMARWYCALSAVLRVLYFGRVPVTGRAPRDRRARIVVASHRNGAIDGYQVMRAFPRVQALVSVQLLRSVILRVLFTGIPVVRRTDVERYGLDPASVADPVEAGCAHLRAGGELLVFPEGTSAWGHSPQRYHRGAAHMAARLTEEGVEVEVVPVGLFYSAPDRFRSRA
jgi:1-acyl-sn-glycerol-3-phosphate acyltransferase